MMRAIVLALPLLIAGCGGGDVESETAETRAADRNAEEIGEENADPAPGEDEIEVDQTGAMVRDDPPDNSIYTPIDDCLGGCQGPGEWTVAVARSDRRDNLRLTDPGGEQHDIDLSTQLAKGAYNSLGDTVEWRLAEKDETPRALIFRMNVARPDPMEADRSILGIARLDGPVCLIGTVPPGPGQNVAARKLADRDEMSECLEAE